MSGRVVDIAGKRYGMLTVVDRCANIGHNPRWFCKCDCGGSVKVLAYHLKSGRTKSCGCLVYGRSRRV